MYSDLSDDKLIEIINDSKDDEATETLIKRYVPLVKRQSRSLYIMGADQEDLIQEGMIGIIKAVNDYQPDKGASFKTFAFMCVRRQLLSAITTSNNKNNSPLNGYISIYGDDEENSSPLNELESDVYTNPEDIMMAKFRESTLISNIDRKLSVFEKKVLNQYLQGDSYQEIGEKLGKPAKSIDNAIQRIRTKLKVNESE
jgi:RNA polymerase sporulation-specific sigma factor